VNQAAIPPASSPATQQLIDLCQEVAAGKRDLYPQLEAAAKLRQDEMNKVSDGFFAEIEKEPEQFQTELKKELELISQLYEGYGQALDTILTCKADLMPEALNEAALMLSFASNGLVSAMNTYEQRVLAQGPRQYPVINLFTNVGAAFRKGETTREAWLGLCSQYKEFYQGALAEIDASNHKNDQGVPERRTALETLVACLARLAALNKASSSSAFEAEIDLFDKGHEALNEAINTFNDASVEGPTSSRAVNTVLLAARSVVAGTMSKHNLRALCGEQLDEICKALAQVRVAAATPCDSPTVLEEGARILEFMEGVQEALELLLAYAESEDGKAEAAQEAMKQLEEATMKLSLANSAISAHNERYGKIVCPSCSTMNTPSRVCSGCGRQLPQMTGSEEFGVGASSSLEIAETPDGLAAGPVMTDVMKKLFDACESYQGGELSADELLAMLDQLDAGVGEARKTILRQRMPTIPQDAPDDQKQDAEEVAEVVTGAVGLLEQGIEDCEFGIAKIRHGVLTDSPDDIREGQQFYFQGTQYMWQVKVVEVQFQNYIKAHMTYEDDPIPP